MYISHNINACVVVFSCFSQILMTAQHIPFEKLFVLIDPSSASNMAVDEAYIY